LSLGRERDERPPSRERERRELVDARERERIFGEREIRGCKREGEREKRVG